jgi:hypothetical protein
MRFILRLFLLSTLIVSFLLETVGSAISFHKCIQPIIVECSSQKSESNACCCNEDGSKSHSKTNNDSQKSDVADVGFDCCKEVNSYFNIPVYQVAQIFVPILKIIDLHSSFGLLKLDVFTSEVSNFVFQ